MTDDSDEKGYEVTIQDPEMIEVKCHFERGIGASLIYLPDLEVLKVTLEAEVKAACASAYHAARTANLSSL